MTLTQSQYLDKDVIYYDKSNWSAFCSKGFHKGCSGYRQDKTRPKGERIQPCECPHCMRKRQ